MNRFLGKFAVIASMAVLSVEASATTLLLDNFDNGTLGTNLGVGAVGNGFVVFNHSGLSGGTAVESAGTVNLKGNNLTAVTSIQSSDTFNPTGLTLTWGINSAVAVPGGSNGVAAGWTTPGGQPGDPTP